MEGNDRPGALGHPVGVAETTAKGGDGAAEQGFPDRGGAIDDQLEAARRRRALFDCLDKALDHGRDEERVGDAVTVDRRQDQCGLGLAQQDGLPALGQRHHAVADPADVKQRHADEIDAGGIEIPGVGRDPGRKGQSAVAQDNAFRLAGRTRGVQQNSRAGGVRVGLRVAGARSRQSIFEHLPEENRRRGVGGKEMFELGRREDQPRLAVGEDRGDLARRQPPVQGHHDRGDLRAGEEQLVEHRRIVRQDRDAVAGTDPALFEQAGQPIAAGVEFGEARRLVAECQTRRIRGSGGISAHHREQGRVTRLEFACGLQPVHQ